MLLSLFTCHTFQSLKDNSLNLIAKYFGNSLETLNLSHSKQVTGKGLRQISKRCEKIISIDLGALPLLEESSVRSILRRSSSTLKSLNVGGNQKIRDAFIQQMMQRDYHDCLIYRR